MFRVFLLTFASVFALVLHATSAPAGVWIEGEKPTSQNAKLSDAGFKAGPLAKPNLQSGGAVLSAFLKYEEAVEKLPAEGFIVGYDFDLDSAGTYTIWARIGYEQARSAFDWRIDGGKWQTLGPEAHTIDLVELSLWNQLGWYKLGRDVKLDSGKHKIEFRHKPYEKTDAKGNVKKTRTLHMLDAIHITDEPFKPNGKFKPGQDYMQQTDEEAARKVYQAPSVPVGRRGEVELTGLWQIARWDEYGSDMEWNEGDIPVRTQWEAAKELPEDMDRRFWYAVPVPLTLLSSKGESGGYAGGSGGNSGKPHLMKFSHRVIYRTKVKVPAEMKGRGFSLDFEQFNMIASVFVNGRLAGWSKNHDAPWEVDLTNLIEPGSVNEIAVVIKSHYYAVNRNRAKGTRGIGLRGIFGMPRNALSSSTLGAAVDFPVSAPKSDGDVPGISDYVKFVVTGGRPYVEDVFAKPSVSDKKLGLEITLENPEDRDVHVELRNSVVPWSREGDWKSARPEKAFQTRRVTAEAKGRSTFDLSFDWKNPTLWWPDDPNLYMIKTEVVRDGKVVDTKWTRFGFRQWGWKDGVLYTINGKPWQFWNDLNKTQLKTPRSLVETAEESGRNSKRFWGKMHRGWGGMSKREILDLFDENGIVVRDTGAFDGQVFNYARGLTSDDEKGYKGYNRRLMRNVLDQQLAWVRGYRNHACILIWTLENEVTFVSAANAGQLPTYCPAIRYVGGKLMELDPTRPVMVDGGDALTDPDTWKGDGEWVEPARKMGYMPVNGGHYTDRGYGVDWNDYPDAAYTAEHWYTVPNERGGWTMVRNQPIHHGEIFYGRGQPVDSLAVIGGEQVYLSDEATFPVRAKIARMLNEGYRFNDVSSAWALFDGDLDPTHQIAWSPIILLVRQWNWTFGSSQEIDRKLRIINQTSKPRKLTGAWELYMDGKKVAGDEKTFDLDICGKEYWSTRFRVPQVREITEGKYVLIVREGDKEHFRDEKPVRFLPWDLDKKPSTSRKTFVLDSSGELKKHLRDRGLAFQEVKSPQDVPMGKHVLLVGRDSIEKDIAGLSLWQQMAQSGMRIVVFEQDVPLRYRALPADYELSESVGRIVHMQMSSHPVLEGMKPADFFCWNDDHTSYKNPYLKPSAGALPILQNGPALAYTTLSESRTDNDGLLIVNQMLCMTKLDRDVVARRLTDQLINYAYDYTPMRRNVLVAMPEEEYPTRLLKNLGLRGRRVEDVLEAIRSNPGSVVVARGSKDNLARLTGAMDQVSRFKRKGGWLVLLGVGPDGLDSFNKLVGVEHLMRPYTREAVEVVLPRKEQAMGVSLGDLVMTTGKRIAWWKGTEFRAHDAYTYVVDYKNVAPFATINGMPPKQDAASMPNPRNVANGLTSAEFWRYLAYFEAAQGQEPVLVFQLPRKETLEKITASFDTGYSSVEQITLDFHDGGGKLKFDVAPGGANQAFEFEPRKTDKVTFTVSKYVLNRDRDIVGISTVEIWAKRSEAFEKKVQPLMQPAALVSYPEGDGGVLLNNINYVPVEANPANLPKKSAITKAVLTNLGAEFAAAQSVVVGTGLKYTPVNLPEDVYNIFPRRDAETGKKPWFRPLDRAYRENDLASLPGEEQRMRGILFHLSDFRMADTPSVGVLAGKNSPVDRKAYKGIPVGDHAAAVFFLHTYDPRQSAMRFDEKVDKAREGKKEKLLELEHPVVLEYVIHYRGGESVVVPVRYRKAIGPWYGPGEAEDMVQAVVAWQAKAQGVENGHLAVYAMQWNNPKPERVVESIDIRLPAGTRGIENYGSPAVFAITTAKTR
jgi:beta-galactosidase